MPTAELLIIRQFVIAQRVTRVTALTVADLFQQLSNRMLFSHRDLAIQILVERTLNVSHRTGRSIAFAPAIISAIRTVPADPNVCSTQIVLAIRVAHETNASILALEHVA